MKTIARIYRFHDKVALYTCGVSAAAPRARGETVYLTADEAQLLGIALISFASDVVNTKFTHSTLETKTIERSE